MAHLSPSVCFSYLLPHLLPSKPGLDTHGLRHPMANTIQRVFKMSFVPVGFWQRFIARMLISLAEMDLQVEAVSALGVRRARRLQLPPGGWAMPLLQGPRRRSFFCSRLESVGPEGRLRVATFSSTP